MTRDSPAKLGERLDEHQLEDIASFISRREGRRVTVEDVLYGPARRNGGR
ncbi:MAG: hypothetical protein ACNS61_14180 [Candidatus Wenzhouxiangella sp. M2_3B_020]